MLHHTTPTGDRSTTRRIRLAAGALALLAVAGCRGNAPNDVFDGGATTESLVFVKTAAEETLNRSWASSNLYRLSPISPEGRVTPITDYVGASVSDPCVSFDGKRILFSMRPPGASDRNIYEIGVDGSDLHQITSGGGHDYDPLYMPDGRILFTSNRDREMDEYNHSMAEHLYRCNADGTGIERLSFNQSDDFDPVLMANGRIVYTRWEHFGTFNRFPLFVMNPDGTGIFHRYGPHNRNFFHAQPTPNGRLIAIESTMVNEDAGPIAVLRLENGPADPVLDSNADHWTELTADVNTDGAPWTYGAFKYPFPIGDNRYVASYTLPAGTEEDTDYALYTFTLQETGSGTEEDPTKIQVSDLTFLYNDPNTNEYDAQLVAAHPKPPVIPDVIDRTKDYGVFTAQDVFNRGTRDGQEVPERGVDDISKIAVIAARPTRVGEANTISANEFEKRALIGFAPVQPDGSFSIKVPADTPISFATLDDHDRGFVVKRTWLSVRPGEVFDNCFGCHEDRAAGTPVPTNPDPMAKSLPPTDLDIDPSQFQVITWEDTIGAIVADKCVSCHQPEPTDPQAPRPTYEGSTFAMPAADLDLTDVPVQLMMENQTFPRGYANLSGESEELENQVVRPAFPRKSVLIDWLLALDSRDGQTPHPGGANDLTANERELFNLWVMLGAQYR